LKEDPPPLATIDLTLPPDDLWDRIRHGFGMPNLDSPLVQQQQAWYLARPDYLRRVVERSRRYMHHIIEELEKRGMPTELALLPIVESAYNPMAYSRAHASGMWQFIPSTGKTYQLDQNWWMDQRRDIIASTSAALEYLQSIYEMHGDWHLALASYNWGENAVARAINKNRAKGLPTDYLSLTMPNETRSYVPKLQALKNIIAQPALFNVSLDPIPNRPYFHSVEVSAHMDVAIAARLAEMTIEEFLALNPAFNRPVIPDKGGANIVLPAEKVDIFMSNLEAHNKPLTSWQAYSIKKGESLDSVAKKHGLSVARLRQVNGINAKMRIGPGHTLLVPARGDAASDNLLAVNLPVAKPTIRKAQAKKGKKSAGKRGKKTVGAKTSPKTVAAKRPPPRN
jgi:membrane-bound lytic murein transglycosylase D